MVRRNGRVKPDEYKWMTPVCTLKFDNNRYPCECQPFWDHWSNVLAPEADCSKCQVAIDYGMMPEKDPEEEEGENKK